MLLDGCSFIYISVKPSPELHAFEESSLRQVTTVSFTSSLPCLHLYVLISPLHVTYFNLIRQFFQPYACLPDLQSVLLTVYPSICVHLFVQLIILADCAHQLMVSPSQLTANPSHLTASPFIRQISQYNVLNYQLWGRTPIHVTKRNSMLSISVLTSPHCILVSLNSSHQQLPGELLMQHLEVKTFDYI